MTDLFDRRRVARLIVLAGLASCTGLAEPDPPGTTKPPAELDFIRIPAGLGTFVNDSVSFYAKVSEKSEGTIYFKTPSGERGDRFAELKLDKNSLLARPDGAPFGPDDSVLIVMKVTDPTKFLVELRPGGLRFSRQHPADLRIRYEATRGDLNGNGKHDKKDDKIEGRLGIWVQERPEDPFVKVGTVKTSGNRELKAELESFSRYAIAY